MNKLVKLYKTATRNFGLAPSEYTPTIALTQAVDVPTVFHPTRINQALQASRTFAKHGVPNEVLRSEAQQIVSANQKTLLKTCQEPSYTQIHQECSDQLNTDEELYYSAPDEYHEAVPSKPLSVPKTTSKVKAMVAAFESRTSHTPTHHFSPNNKQLVGGSPTPILNNLRPDSPPTDDDDDDELLNGPSVFRTCVSSPSRSSLGGAPTSTKQTQPPNIATTTTKGWNPVAKLPLPQQQAAEEMRVENAMDVQEEEEDRKPAAKVVAPRAAPEMDPTPPIETAEEPNDTSPANQKETGAAATTAPAAGATTGTLSVDTDVPPAATTTKEIEAIEEGTTVQVQSRTWPGINQRKCLLVQ